jgi:hypothetical protein
LLAQQGSQTAQWETTVTNKSQSLKPQTLHLSRISEEATREFDRTFLKALPRTNSWEHSKSLLQSRSNTSSRSKEQGQGRIVASVKKWKCLFKSQATSHHRVSSNKLEELIIKWSIWDNHRKLK